MFCFANVSLNNSQCQGESNIKCAPSNTSRSGSVLSYSYIVTLYAFTLFCNFVCFCKSCFSRPQKTFRACCAFGCINSAPVQQWNKWNNGLGERMEINSIITQLLTCNPAGPDAKQPPALASCNPQQTVSDALFFLCKEDIKTVGRRCV